MRSRGDHHDAVVVGAGPNGLAAAITLAQAGRSVLVLEAADTIGGGARTQELTLPGFRHDVCSAVHPLALGSPFFQTLPLAEHGLHWIHPPYPFAHPLDDGTAVTAHRSLADTADGLGADGPAYTKLIAPLVEDWPQIAQAVLGPVWPPKHPLSAGRFGLHALRSAKGLAYGHFTGERARALFAGVAAHAVRPLDSLASAAPGLVLTIAAHAGGWPIPEGGAQSIADALASYLRSLGGEIVTGVRVESEADLPDSQAVLFDLNPHQVLRIAGHRLPDRYASKLSRYRYGPGVFKIDFALNGPIPWRAAECSQASTVHLGGTFEEIAQAEADVWKGIHPERPYVLMGQPTPFDPTRAPEGKHVAWAYCHVPNGSTFDMSGRIERQIERFAPGFRDLILARHSMTASQMAIHNPNYVGGDIASGSNDLRQLIARPVMRLDPYSTPAKGVYICSSSTPPGAGVHGMCGHNAARSALRFLSRL